MKDDVYIIAEAGVNHNGERDLAFSLVDSAAASGADAIKFQTFNAKKLAKRCAPKAAYQKSTTNTQESQQSMLEKLELPQKWHLALQSYAKEKGIEFLSTAFDTDSLNFLSSINIPLFKVPSGELTNAPLLWKFARTGKNLIVSTGMATLSEVEQALAVIAHALNAQTEPSSLEQVWQGWSQPKWRDSLKARVTLLHCTSQYPTPFDQVNLHAMDTLSNAFGLEVGYSDHTQGILIPLAAVARGAKVIEKHFTLDKNLPGPDHSASIEPEELKKMVTDIRALHVALGDGHKAPQPSEWDTRQAARQQVIAARSICAGHSIQREDLTTARCGQGIPAHELWSLVGTISQSDFSSGDVIWR